VNKPSPKGPVVRPQDKPASVARLDEKITQLAVKTTKAVQRHRNAILSIIAVGVLAMLGVWAHREYRRSQERALSSRVFLQFHSKSAEKLAITGMQPAEIARMLEEIRSLITDARGTDSERWITKEAVDYLIDKALDQALPPSEVRDPLALRDPTEPEAKDPAPPSPELLGEAEKLVREARERFKDDRDLQYWAEQSERSIQALLSWDIKTATRPFRPVLPPAEETRPEGSPIPPALEPESSETPR
jgi:hypothetical protein